MWHLKAFWSMRIMSFINQKQQSFSASEVFRSDAWMLKVFIPQLFLCRDKYLLHCEMFKSYVSPRKTVPSFFLGGTRPDFRIARPFYLLDRIQRPVFITRPESRSRSGRNFESHFIFGWHAGCRQCDYSLDLCHLWNASPQTPECVLNTFLDFANKKWLCDCECCCSAKPN